MLYTKNNRSTIEDTRKLKNQGKFKHHPFNILSTFSALINHQKKNKNKTSTSGALISSSPVIGVFDTN